MSIPQVVHHKTVPRFVTLVRWASRLGGTAVFLLITLIAVGEGVQSGLPNPWKQPWGVNVELHLMLAMYLAFILAWKWELPGGLTLIVGMLGFCAIEHRFMGIQAAVVLLIGAGYLFCWAMDRRQRQAPSATRDQQVIDAG